METHDQKIFEIFGPLVNRLNDIENYNIYIQPDYQNDFFKELKKVELYKVSPEVTVPFIDGIIDQIYDIKNHILELEDRIFHAFYSNQKNEHRISGKKLTASMDLKMKEKIQTKAASYRSGFENELYFYIEDLNKLHDGLEKYQNLIPNNTPVKEIPLPVNKLKINLPMEELVGMIKVFIECEYIPSIKPDELHTIISQHFESKRGGEMGETSIRKKLYPNKITLNKLADIFGELQKKSIILKRKKN